MVFFYFVWRLVRRRWVRRVLLWLVVRLIRLFGWRRAVRLLFRGRGRWRLLAVGVWRAVVLLLRVGRSALMLAGRVRARSSPSLTHRTPAVLRSTVVPKRRRLTAADTRSVRQLGEELRRTLPSRVARRRDDIRRSVLAALGVDPNWRPPSRRAVGPTTAADRKPRPELGERAPQ
jgi:hypothetical protein